MVVFVGPKIMDYLFWALSTLAWSDLAICFRFVFVLFSFFNYFIQRKRNKGGPGVFIVIAFLENILFCFVRSLARKKFVKKMFVVGSFKK